MKRNLILCASILACSMQMWAVDADIQVFYDFGSMWNSNACQNHRTERVTTTAELFHADNWGSTFFFADFDYSVAKEDPTNSLFGAYWEITRSLNFWKNTKAKDLSLHVEYDGGCGIYGSSIAGGYAVKHAALFGPEYFLHTDDYKNTFTLQLLFKYIANENNMWHEQTLSNDFGKGNIVPLQFTFVWGCKDFCTVKGLTFSGFLDIWGERQSVPKWDKLGDKLVSTYGLPEMNCVFLTEPQLWYAVGQHFGCPNLNIGTEIEISCNFTGKGWMCNPCVGLRWNFL